MDSSLISCTNNKKKEEAMKNLESKLIEIFCHIDVIPHSQKT